MFVILLIIAYVLIAYVCSERVAAFWGVANNALVCPLKGADGCCLRFKSAFFTAILRVLMSLFCCGFYPMFYCSPI